MKSIIIVGAVAVALLVLAAACTTEKTVYVLPDGTEVTPTAAQATQAAGGGSQAASSQPATASTQPTPAPVGSVSQSEVKTGARQLTQPDSAASPRWNDRRNTLCSSLGLDASLCEKIALNQTGPDGDEQDIDLPVEPDATPVPVDDVGAATGELNEIVASEGEVSIQVLTYTENLIQQAADAVVQAEQELVNQEATAAYLDAKKQELQELRQTYARLLERIGVAQDRSLALAEQIEQEHLQFSIDRANGEALIRYKDARLAHTNALAEAEKNAIDQIEGIAAANELASTHEADTVDLAPLYAEKDKAQARYDQAVKEFEKQVQDYESQWLAAYEYYIADEDKKPEFPKYRGGRCGSEKECFAVASYVIRRSDRQSLIAGATSIREQGKPREDVNLTILQKDLTDAERVMVRAIARNEKAQDEVSAYSEKASAVGIAITNARLAAVESYLEHGISEGKAGAIFKFTDSGEDAFTYNLSLVGLNQQAEANLADFKDSLSAVIDNLNAEFQTAEMVRVNSLEQAEDERFESADTDAQEQQGRDEWGKLENLRNRIIMLDSVMMLVGWGRALRSSSGHYFIHPGFGCAFDSDGYRSATGTGRDEYIRRYLNKERPLNRTYTLERLTAAEGVLDNLEEWLQERIDFWESEGRDGERYLQQCETTLHGDPERNGYQGMKEWRQAIIAETTPIPD